MHRGVSIESYVNLCESMLDGMRSGLKEAEARNAVLGYSSIHGPFAMTDLLCPSTPSISIEHISSHDPNQMIE
jgi:hypothetical protein